MTTERPRKQGDTNALTLSDNSRSTDYPGPVKGPSRVIGEIPSGLLTVLAPGFACALTD
jgi:hypothetical protein